MDVLTFETRCAVNNEIIKASDIKLVYLYSTIKMMHGPINVRFACYFTIPLVTVLTVIDTAST